MALGPKVSIVLPTFNRGKIISNSIESVLAQTYENFELIIIDDASTDNTEDVIKSFDDPRVIYICHECNRGGAAARNTGLAAAKGEFIAFQDSDDIWAPDKLEKQVHLLTDTSSEVGVIYTGILKVNPEKKEYIPGSNHEKLEGNIFKELLKENFVGTPAAVVKKECFEKVGVFDEALPRFQDWDLFLRIAKFYEFRYLPEPLLTAHYTDDSISSNHKALRQAAEILIYKYEEEYKLDRSFYARKLFSISNSYLAEGDLQNCRRYLIKAIKVNSRPGLILLLLVSFLGVKATRQYLSVISRIME